VDKDKAGGGPLIINGTILDISVTNTRTVFTIAQRGNRYQIDIDLSTARITVTPDESTIVDN
jgi:hypothetical protein